MLLYTCIHVVLLLIQLYINIDITTESIQYTDYVLFVSEKADTNKEERPGLSKQGAIKLTSWNKTDLVC